MKSSQRRRGIERAVGFVVALVNALALLCALGLMFALPDRALAQEPAPKTEPGQPAKSGKSAEPAPKGEKKAHPPNRLIHEKSPYLLQHAHNPVDWHPWGQEAFDKAKKENKLIFLSIGYATCHWCHVMERESFEDLGLAKLMNEVFVCIKVDREERLDVDNLYMNLCQILRGTPLSLSGGCGWPLNVILLPDRQPLYVATYLPKESRFGRMGMQQLVPRLKLLWDTQRDGLTRQGADLTEILKKQSEIEPGGELGQDVLDAGRDSLQKLFDETHGGFGGAPRFPTPHRLSFLFRMWHRAPNPELLKIVETTLQAMRKGGIYDHVGFGFHRYSVDEKWLVPHFEKMLYDQAQLVTVYTEAYQITGKAEYRQTAEEICEYVLRDMTHPQGGFSSAQDADSEGEEGKYYLWTDAELARIVGPDDADLCRKVWNVRADGNFSDPATGEQPGSNILHRTKSLAELAVELNLSEDALRTRLEAARQKLLAERAKRIPPLLDDKVLTDWNGLMIAALARAGRVFAKPEYVEAARRARDFIHAQLRDPQGRLLHRYRDGQSAIRAHLDDYAFFIAGLIELHAAAGDVRDLQAALTLQDQQHVHFWDDKQSGYFFTADDAEALLVRTKESYDGAVPAGNSVALLNLLQLARLTGRTAYEEQAAKLARALARPASLSPTSHTQLLCGVDFALGPAYEVVVAGSPAAEDTQNLLRKLRSVYAPNMVLHVRPAGELPAELQQLAPFLAAQRPASDGSAQVYVCRNFLCERPTRDIAQVLQALGVATSKSP